MLLLLVVALISTPAFYTAAKRHGLHPGKLASLPFFGLGILLIVNYLVSLVLQTTLDYVVTTPTTKTLIVAAYNLFIVLVYLVFIRHIWKTLSGAGGEEAHIE